MGLPTTNQVQAVDSVLTNMMVGYRQDDTRFVALRAFPAVQVAERAGTYYIATKKYWFLDELQQRAPGGDFRSVGYGLTTSTYETLQWAAEQPIADEDIAANQAPVGLEVMAVSRLANLSAIRKERAFAADFMTTSVWANDDTTTNDWDDFVTGDPAKDILDARRTISNNTGMDGNTMVAGYIVYQALTLHPDIIDRIKYTQAAGQNAVESALSNVLGINVLVSKATYNSANEAGTFTAAAIIDDDALICHVNPNAGVFDATAGKTFVWAPGGGAGMIYRDRNTNHANLIQHKEQWDQKVVASDMGYFFSDVV